MNDIGYGDTLFKRERFLKGEHKYQGLTILSLLPFCLNTIFHSVILSLIRVDGVNRFITIPIWISLLISGVGFSSNNKKWNIIASISTLLFTVSSVIIGYYGHV